MYLAERMSPTTPPVTETFDTAEVRWFGSGELPPDVLDWFTEGGTLGVCRKRTDSYQLNGAEHRGVKLRATALLEVKTLLGVGPSVSPLDGLVGTIEEWRKVRNAASPEEIVRGFPFADIAKSIVTRSFRYVDEVAVPIDVPDRAHTGCHVDLISIRVNGVRAWSYAFEAYGEPRLRVQALKAAITGIDHRTPHPAELADLLSESMGYPAWINRLAVDGLLSPDYSRWPTAPDASGVFT